MARKEKETTSKLRYGGRGEGLLTVMRKKESFVFFLKIV